MVTHRLLRLALVALPLALIGACDKVPLLAPTGSTINMFATTTAVSLNSEVDIIATVIENGTAAAGTGTGTGPGTGTTTTKGAGTPVQNGTLVSFTTTIGRIEPADARTHNGQVTVKLITGGTSGTATVTAYSGGATTQLTNLKIGTAAVKTVSVTTTPQSLGASGGTTQVVASVTDEGGSALGGVPVTFSTDKGSISPSTVVSDSSGVATATLTTNATAKVTAVAGAGTGSSTVTVNARSLASFTANPPTASAGVPIAFTVTPATGANISDVRVDFGDGSSASLGPIGAATTVPHIYNASGNYTPVVTARDGSGDSGTLSTTVIIGSLPITLTAPSPVTVNSPASLTVGGIGAAQVDHYTWTFDDGTGPFTTTAPQLSHTFSTRGAKNVQVDVFGIGGGKIGTASTRLEVQ